MFKHLILIWHENRDMYLYSVVRKTLKSQFWPQKGLGSTGPLRESALLNHVRSKQVSYLQKIFMGVKIEIKAFVV